jgi:hypothetical protein
MAGARHGMCESALIKPTERLLRSMAAPNTKLLPLLRSAGLDNIRPQNPAGANHVVRSVQQRCITEMRTATD